MSTRMWVECKGCRGALERSLVSYRIGRRPYCAGCFDTEMARRYTPEGVCRRCGQRVGDNRARHTAAHDKAAA